MCCIELEKKRESALLAGVDAGAYFYFAHSYAVLDSNDAAATCSHGTKFAAVIEQQNIFAVQFHPEKSGDSGARVLQNFLRLPASPSRTLSSRALTLPAPPSS